MPYLFGHLVLHVSLDPPQHERFEDHVEPGQLVRVQSPSLLGVALNVAREPLVELLVRVEHGGHDEMEEGPQLGKEMGRKVKPLVMDTLTQ